MIQSVVRAIRILKAFSREEQELGISELSRRLRLHKSVVHRLAATLEQEGLLIQNQTTGKYRIGVKAFEIGILFVVDGSIGEPATPLLRDLARRTGYTARLGVLDESSMVVIASMEGRGAVRAASALGLRLPLHATAGGKVILAHLPPGELDSVVGRTGLPRYTSVTVTSELDLERQLDDIRRSGYAINIEELHRGLGSIAAPVFDRTDQCVAALSLTYPIQLVGPGENGDLIREVVDAAAALSRQLGASAFCPSLTA